MRRLLVLELSLGCASVVKASRVRLVAPQTPMSFSKFIEFKGKVYGSGDYRVLGKFTDTLVLPTDEIVRAEEITSEVVKRLGGDGVVELRIILPKLGQDFPVQEDLDLARAILSVFHKLPHSPT